LALRDFAVWSVGRNSWTLPHQVHNQHFCCVLFLYSAHI